MRPERLADKAINILCWNVNSLRAFLKKVNACYHLGPVFRLLPKYCYPAYAHTCLLEVHGHALYPNKIIWTVQNVSVLKDLVDAEHADVLCLQETKLQDQHIAAEEGRLGKLFWLPTPSKAPVRLQ